jgi:hypothetical protein
MKASTIVDERPQAAKVPNPQQLVDQTQAYAAQVFAAVSAQYLEFRRTYYHEAHPTLDSLPNAHAEVSRAELAQLAESALRLVPQVVRSVPLIGGFLDHLQQVANIHSMSERERTALHNMTMSFLHGIQGGIQPWYVEWFLASAHNLSGVTHAEYFMAFPWDALLYRDPHALALFDTAVRSGDTAAIRREIGQLGDRLIAVLRDPIGVQVELAFAGPDGERRKLLFRLKTAAALALVAYLVVEETRAIIHPRREEVAPRSALAPMPPELAAHAIAE